MNLLQVKKEVDLMSLSEILIKIVGAGLFLAAGIYLVRGGTIGL